MAREIDLEKSLKESSIGIAYDRLLYPATERAIYRNSRLTREANMLDLQKVLGVQILRAYAITSDNSAQKEGIYLEWISKGIKTIARMGPIPIHCRNQEAFGFGMPVDNEQALIETRRI